MINSVNIENKKKTVVRINLPLSMLVKCNDKKVLRSTAISVFIKAHNQDSVLRGLDIRNIKSIFSCGQNKAKQIQKELKSNNTLFKFKGHSNSVVARTFKTRKNVIKTTDKLNRDIWMMYSIGLDICVEWNLYEVEKYIHNQLYLNAINATERSDKFHSNRVIKPNILSATKEALTMTKMAKIGGVCRATAYRHLYKLQGEDVISIKKGGLQIVSYTPNEESLKADGLDKVRIVYDENCAFAYIISANEYHILDRSTTKRFRNIILNHKKRLVHHSSNKVYNRVFKDKDCNEYVDLLAQYN